jgi:hypothetical protein
MTKVIVNTSEKKVLRKRYSYLSEMGVSGAALTLIVTELLATFGIAAPLDMAFGFSTDDAFIVSGVSGVGMALLFAKGHLLHDFLSKVESDMGRSGWDSKFQVVKAFLLPRSSKKLPPMTKQLSSNWERIATPVSHSYDNASKYHVETKVVSGIFSSYVEQTITPTPIAVWDEAFSSAKEIYPFGSKTTKLEKAGL